MKKIPLGYSDFKEILSNPEFLYVDKTELISEFLEGQSKVLLITRPRRFGKTLNLSTLRYFFDQENSQENKKLFCGLKISHNLKAMALQGTRPVIYFTLKDCKEQNWENFQKKIGNLLAELMIPWTSANNLVLEEPDQNTLKRLRAGTEEITLLADSLKFLSRILSSHYGQSPLILIDEYDVPLQTAWLYGYYDEAISFFRNFFSAAFKDNPYLWRGVMTGCLRISKESIFTGLNNLEISSVVSEGYSSHFGLNRDEVKSLLVEYGVEDKTQAIERWYNGYIFGKTVIYNPWSILSFLMSGEIKAHWVNTSSNDMVHSLLRTSSIEGKKNLEELMAGRCVEASLLEHSVFDLIDKDTNNLWNFLYFTGYLKAESIVYPENGKPKALFKIPNQEVLIIFQDSITYWFQESSGYESLKNLHTYLKNGDGQEFSLLFENLVSESFSYFDIDGKKPEQFYHAFTLGLIVTLSDTWNIRSNREAGTGRCDILMTPKNPDHFGVVMELKTFHPKLEKNLTETAKRAMDQIEKKQYAKELYNQGCKKVIKIGIGFSGKETEILYSIL
ncbi:MAG: AAA family ATPase [Candidatus Cloacimonetes bacterium]|nr:AAA family ATPase [Candidatus Cloacimonadota bacterium]